MSVAALPVAPVFASSAQEGIEYDDPQEWAAFSRPVQGSDALWESQLVVQGMHCAACSFNVEQALAGLSGVASAEVNAASERARLVWDPSQVQPSGWMQAVRHAGYRLLPAADAFTHEQRRKQQRLMLWRWLVAGFCMMQVMMYALPAYVAGPGEMTADVELLLRWASWVLTLPVVFFSCGPFFSTAWRDLVQRRISMDLPVALGIAITFAVSTAATFDAQGWWGHEVWFDSLTMFVFFLLTGRWLELRLRDRTAGALDALMQRLPVMVDLQQPDGSFQRVAGRRLAVGDVIRVRAGESFAADGRIVDGSTLADEALLTGESRPLSRGAGDAVLAGSNNLSATVLVRVERVGQTTRFAQIVALMERASIDKPRLAQLADRVARPFLVLVLLAAAGAAIWWWPTDPGRALMAAVAVLVVTCPCALSLASPAAVLASAGALARRGVMVQRLQALETLAQVDTLVFDKTGTLTEDRMVLAATRVRAGWTAAQALQLAAMLARHSLHPASRALAAAAGEPAAPDGSIEQVSESMGQGVQGRISRVAGLSDGTMVRLGSAAWCGVSGSDAVCVQVHLSDEQGWLASFDLDEAIRPDAAAMVQALQAAGLQVQVLSGDRQASVQAVAQRVGISHARGDCGPDDKLAMVKSLQALGHRVAMVGDGLNDGPVLAGADVSVAMGEAVPLARAHSDFVVLGGKLGTVAQLLLQARRTMRIVRQNLIWAALYNAVCVPLAVAGYLPAWLAGLGMAISSLAVIANAARLSRQLSPT
jgi:Cu2+-exporting ATPase